MGILLAIFITLLVMGSILWVKPSPREKAISDMRTKALSLGIKVRLLDQKLAQNLFPWIDNYRPYTLYELPLAKEQRPPGNKPMIVRLRYSERVHELDRVDALRDALEDRDLLNHLPESAEALVISPSGIALLWIEDTKSASESVEQVKTLIAACRENADLWA